MKKRDPSSSLYQGSKLIYKLNSGEKVKIYVYNLLYICTSAICKKGGK